MLDGGFQRKLAKIMRALLAEKGIDVVFVGSTAIIAHDLFPRTSKDVDALASPEVSLSQVRGALETIAREEALRVEEKGWGTVSLVSPDDQDQPLWSVDVLVPDEGPIPQAAARRIRRMATQTDIGPAAIVAHIVAMKAIAYGDCLRDGRSDLAENYESDLLQIRGTPKAEIDWSEVSGLLSAFQTARRTDAEAKILEVFGKHLGPGNDHTGYG